jgi:hypothetical protein
VGYETSSISRVFGIGGSHVNAGVKIRGLTITPDFPLTYSPGVVRGKHVIPVVIEAETHRVLVTVRGSSGTFSWPTVGKVLERGQRLQIPVTVDPVAGSAAQATLTIEARDPDMAGIPRRMVIKVKTASGRRRTASKPRASA